MRRTNGTDCHNFLIARNVSEEKFERAEFVATNRLATEIVAFDPQVGRESR
jgi:hypothetical protein